MAYLFFIFIFIPRSHAETTRLADLIQRVETQHLADTSYALATMQIQKDGWSRELKLEMFGKGRDHFLATILSPPRDRGVKSLKIENQMWNYMPAIDRTIKIPSSLMGDAWMGSHFTNDDLLKGNRIEELCSLSLVQETSSTAVIDAVPQANAPIVWGKIRYHLDLNLKAARKVQYFDEEMNLIRTMVFSDFQKKLNRHIPMRTEMRPHHRQDERTRVIYENLELNQPLSSGLFTVRGLRRRLR